MLTNTDKGLLRLTMQKIIKSIREIQLNSCKCWQTMTKRGMGLSNCFQSLTKEGWGGDPYHPKFGWHTRWQSLTLLTFYNLNFLNCSPSLLHSPPLSFFSFVFSPPLHFSQKLGSLKIVLQHIWATVEPHPHPFLGNAYILTIFFKWLRLPYRCFRLMILIFSGSQILGLHKT